MHDKPSVSAISVNVVTIITVLLRVPLVCSSLCCVRLTQTPPLGT